MTRPPSDRQFSGSDRQARAADWFVRLQGETAPGDWASFQDWLEENPGNAAAYAEVERLWVELESPAVDWPRPAARRVDRVRRRAFWAGITAAAAALALAVFIPMTLPRYKDYHTGKGERLAVTLQDDSTLLLSGDTHLRVRLSGRHRDVELASGEATFDVVHDARRPFVVALGDREVRVLGTNFDIKRQDDLLAVTVRRGAVSVGVRDHGGQTASVVAGQQLKLVGAEPVTVRRVNPEDAFAWTSGRLVYASAPLTEVASDLGRYLPLPVRVDPGAQDIRVSGVLKIDQEGAMIDRLKLFIPIDARKTDREIVLTARTPRR